MECKYDMKKLKSYEVKILDYFVSICEENNISYYLAYGTLLGAIRHKGFIPWDDDIDVYVKPEDYYSLKKIMNKNENKKFFYQSLETEKYFSLTFDKIRMNNTEAIEEKTEKEPIHKGIYIDIFPLVPFPNDKKIQDKMFNNLKLINLLIEADLKDKTKYNNYGKVGKIMSKILRLIPRKLRNEIAIRKLQKILLCKEKFDNYICIIDNKVFSKKSFDKKTKVTFEKKKYNAPKDYDKYLNDMYGDYMTLPKEEDRVSHSFIRVTFDVEDKHNER